MPQKFLEVDHSFYWELYQNLVCEISKKESFAVLEILPNEMIENLKMPNIIKDGQADALFVVGKTSKKYALKLNREFLKPLVFLDYHEDELNCDSVEFNNYLGMYKVTKYLLAMGHRKIAFVGNIYATNSICDRYYGMLRALLEEEIVLPDEWTISDRVLESGKIQITLPKHMPTAFICNSDLSASYLMEELKKNGYRVPQDVSVAGFDNFQTDSEYADWLTTYDVNKRGMASEGMKMIINRLRNPEDKRIKRKIVDGRVLIKESVRKIS